MTLNSRYTRAFTYSALISYKNWIPDDVALLTLRDGVPEMSPQDASRIETARAEKKKLRDIWNRARIYSPEGSTIDDLDHPHDTLMMPKEGSATQQAIDQLPQNQDVASHPILLDGLDKALERLYKLQTEPNTNHEPGLLSRKPAVATNTSQLRGNRQPQDDDECWQDEEPITPCQTVQTTSRNDFLVHDYLVYDLKWSRAEIFNYFYTQLMIGPENIGMDVFFADSDENVRISTLPRLYLCRDAYRIVRKLLKDTTDGLSTVTRQLKKREEATMHILDEYLKIRFLVEARRVWITARQRSRDANAEQIRRLRCQVMESKRLTRTVSEDNKYVSADYARLFRFVVDKIGAGELKMHNEYWARLGLPVEPPRVRRRD
jgi:hypothetical protein